MDAMVHALGGFLGLKFREWQLFYELEPPEDVRTEFGLSRIIQTLLRSEKPLSEFLLPFGDRSFFSPVVVQSVEQQERMIDAWISGSNAVVREKQARGISLD